MIKGKIAESREKFDNPRDTAALPQKTKRSAIERERMSKKER